MTSDRALHLDEEERLNNLVAAGSIWMVCSQAGLDPKVITEDDGATATNRISVRVGPHLKSRYRLTVERIPGTDEELPDAGECDCPRTWATVDGDVADLDQPIILHNEDCIVARAAE